MEVLIAAAAGGLFGFAADRLSARWPVHEDGRVRAMDWRTFVVIVGSAASFAALAARWSDPADLLVLGIYVAALMVLLATDLDQKLLPDLIILPLIGYAAAVLRELGHEVQEAALLGDEPGSLPSILDVIASGDVSPVINTPAPRSGAVLDAAAIRHAAIAEGVLCLTAIDTARAAAHSLEPAARSHDREVWRW